MKEVCPVCNETVFYDDADSADLSSERSSWWERHRTSAKHVAYRNRKGLEVLGYDRLPGMVGIEQTTQFKVLRMAGFGERRRATSYAVVGEQGRRVVLEREAWFPAWAVVLADVSVRAIPEPRLWEAATMIHRMRHDPDGQAAVLTTWRMTHRDSAVLDYAFGRVRARRRGTTMRGNEVFDSWPQSSSEAELDAAVSLFESLHNAGWREVSSCFEQAYVRGSLPRVVLKALDVPFVHAMTGTTYVADAVQATMELWTDRYVAVCLGALEHLPRATPEDRGLSFDSVYGYLSRALDVRSEHEVAVFAVEDLGGAEAVCDLLVAMGAWSGVVPVMPPTLFGATSAALAPQRDPETDELLPVDGWDARCPVPKPDTRCWYE